LCSLIDSFAMPLSLDGLPAFAFAQSVDGRPVWWKAKAVVGRASAATTPTSAMILLIRAPFGVGVSLRGSYSIGFLRRGLGLTSEKRLPAPASPAPFGNPTVQLTRFLQWVVSEW
jgi:hypothetical protein